MTLISLALDIWTIEIEKERDSNVMAGRDSYLPRDKEGEGGEGTERERELHWE